MSGRVFVIGLLVFVLVFAVGLWYAQTQAWYEEVDGLPAVEIAGRAVPVSGYRGLEGASPLKLRGCFRLDPDALAGLDAPPAEEPGPLTTPGWFDCYAPERIGADLEAGRARALIAERDDPAGFDRIVAVYPDGRAFMWRQVRE